MGVGGPGVYVPAKATGADLVALREAILREQAAREDAAMLLPAPTDDADAFVASMEATHEAAGSIAVRAALLTAEEARALAGELLAKADRIDGRHWEDIYSDQMTYQSECFAAMLAMQRFTFERMNRDYGRLKEALDRVVSEETGR